MLLQVTALGLLALYLLTRGTTRTRPELRIPKTNERHVNNEPLPDTRISKLTPSGVNLSEPTDGEVWEITDGQSLSSVLT
jgi:hypothetical protein